MTTRNIKYKWVPGLAIFLAGLLLGFFFFGNKKQPPKDMHEHTASEKKEEVWTCSMHPNVRKSKPGQCPICFMDLIRLKEDSGSTDGKTLKLSAAARKLAEVKTAPVLSGPATRTLRLPGTVQLDETRIKHVTAWVGGRIEKLYVNYTGIPVNKGDHMAEFYSPDLLAAQEELRRSTGNENLHRNVIERLLRWGIDRKQINSFKSSTAPSELVTINSPAAGIVVEKAVKEGMYVKQGTRLFSIADMNQLWLMAKIYERDIQWLRYGQPVECEFEAFPGRIFPGTIAFIAPVLSETSRTVDARINIDNKNGLLTPGMFGRITIKVTLGKGGEVVSPALAGKWISPMHPEIIKDGPGTCDVCGMDLVPIESMGFKTQPVKEMPLIVPETSVLWSGTRSIVFKEVKHEETGLYEANEVVLGPKVDNGYMIFSGLSKDDRVVIEGAFKLDAEQQIRAKTSMMSPDREIVNQPASTGQPALSAKETALVEKQIKLCLNISTALAADNLAAATQAAKEAHNALPDLKNTNSKRIKELADKMMPILMKMMQRSDIQKTREDLFRLTPILKELISSVENKLSFAIHEDYCPMAFNNKGAGWFQPATELANPYYGAMMLRCGETKKVWNKGSEK